MLVEITLITRMNDIEGFPKFLEPLAKEMVTKQLKNEAYRVFNESGAELIHVDAKILDSKVGVY